jgi:hypothetical protein
MSLEMFVEQNPLLALVILVWILIWKGLALWRAAQKKSKWWFIAILVFNTVGILEILYLFVFSKPKDENQKLQ